MREKLLSRFMEELVVELEGQHREGTAHVYRSTLNRLKGFTGGHDLRFRQLTCGWLADFERHLLSCQLKWNTVSTYMRMLRSVYHRALERGLAPYTPRLFSRVYTGIDSRTKRAVPAGAICRLMTAREELPARLSFGRDMFVLLFLLRGMPFADLVFLRKCDLHGTTLTYHRRKTGRRMCVSVCPEAMAIIRRYRDTRPDSPYLFPFILHPGRDEYGQYARTLRRENYCLLRVARLLGIREHLSTYTARHTWATTALRQRYASRLICDAMGHSSVKVTETYFQSFREREIDRMNRSLIAFVLSRNPQGRVR